MKPADPRAHLLEFLAGIPGPRAGNNLRELDSLGLLQVVVYLENTYGIDLAAAGIEPDDLRSVESVLALIERRGG
jgi:hypothetical protein